MLDIAAELALGCRTVGYVEREAFAAAILLARMEDKALEPAPVWCGNLEQFDAAAWRGAVDCVTAGFPCQPWSAAGKREGFSDERWIWPAIAGIIRESGAWLVCLENVPGLVSGRGLNRVLGDLAEMGFDAEWGCLTAASVGASHKRERIFIVAIRAGERSKLRQLSAGWREEEWLREADADRGSAELAVAAQRRRGELREPSRSDGFADRGEQELENAARSESQSRSWRGICEGSAELGDTECAERGPLDNTCRAQEPHAIPQRQESPRRPGVAGQDVAQPAQQREREPDNAECAIARPDAREDAGGRSGWLGEPNQPDAQRRRGEDSPQRREVAHGHAGLAGRTVDSAAAQRCNDARLGPDAHSESGECLLGEGCDGIFAPGPAWTGWPAIIQAMPHLAPAIEPSFRLLADGLAMVVDEARSDQLRCIGNGVVPLQAAVTFRILAERLLAR